MSYSSAFRTPFIDRSKQYSTAAIESKDCNMQQYMALFLSKPHLYSEVHSVALSCKQDVFFEKFSRFLSKYIEPSVANPNDELRFDTDYYFSDLSEYKVNTMNISGGEKRSGSERRNMISAHTSIADKRKQVTDYLQRKYGWNLKESDPRLFLGHTKPWLNPSPELLELQDYNSVISCAYDDENMSVPLPEKLEKHLIPLKIRNKVLTAWRNERNKISEIETLKIKEKMKRQRELEDAKESGISVPKVLEHIKIDDEDW
jgi:hypothetical protein